MSPAVRHRGRRVTPRLVTERLLLDPVLRDDAGALAATLADPALYAFMGGEPPSVEAMRAQIEGWIAGPARAGDAWHNWAIRLAADGTLVGHLQATATGFGEAADIAWIVGVPWQGRGYASEAAIALVAWLESTGVRAITAHVHPEHGASGRVAERAGLEPTDVVEGGEIVWRRVVSSARTRDT